MAFGKKKDKEVVAPVEGGVVRPEDTVKPLDVVPHADEFHPEGGVQHNTNDSLDRIKESEDEANNPVVSSRARRDTSFDRKKGESQLEYNERVPVALQPVQPAPTHNYLGQPL